MKVYLRMTTTKALVGLTISSMVAAIGLSMCYTDHQIYLLRQEPIYVRMLYTTNAPTTTIPVSPR